GDDCRLGKRVHGVLSPWFVRLRSGPLSASRLPLGMQRLLVHHRSVKLVNCGGEIPAFINGDRAKVQPLLGRVVTANVGKLVGPEEKELFRSERRIEETVRSEKCTQGANHVFARMESRSVWKRRVAKDGTEMHVRREPDIVVHAVLLHEAQDLEQFLLKAHTLFVIGPAIKPARSVQLRQLLCETSEVIKSGKLFRGNLRTHARGNRHRHTGDNHLPGGS